MERQETLENIVASVHLTVPFQNMRDLWRLHNDEERMPNAFGGSCVWQVAEVSAAIRERVGAVDVRHHNRYGQKDSSHMIGVWHEGEEEWFFEPTLLLRKCPNLREARQNGTVRVATYNSEEGKPMIRSLNFAVHDPKLLQLRSSDVNHIYDTHTIQTEISLPLDERDDRFSAPLTHEARDGLYYHILDGSGRKHYAILPLSTPDQRMFAGVQGGEKVREGHRKFMHTMDAIADLTGMTGQALLRLFKDSHDLYREIHPKKHA